MTDKLVQFKGTVYEEGWGMVAKKVMKDKSITVGARCLYAYLCTFVKQGSGTAFPGRDKICFDLNINKNTFNKYRTELTQNGYVIVTQNREKKKYGNNVYSIETIQQCTKKQDTENQDTEKQDTEKVDSKSTSIKNTNNKNTNNKNTNSNREFLSQIENKYFKTFKTMISTTNVELIQSYIDDGLEPDVILYALDYSKQQKARHFKYTKTILDNWIEKGFKTLDVVKAELERNTTTEKVKKCIDALKNMDLEEE